MAKNIRVKIAQLKANLSSYLKRVRAGEEVIVEDRDTPIGIIRGIDSPNIGFETRPPITSGAEIQKIRSPLKIKLPRGLLDEILQDLRSER